MAGMKRRGGAAPGKEKRARMTLEDQIESETVVSSRARSKKSKSKQENDDYVDASMSGRILKEARKQMKEIQKEEDEEDERSKAGKAFEALEKNVAANESDDEEDDIFDSKSEFDPAEGHEISEEEERILSMFMAKDAPPQRTLTDMIMSKIQNCNATQDLLKDEGRTVPGFDQKVIDVYRGVGKLLSRYTAGKLPKAFKIVTALAEWEQALYLTEPENWSPNAVYQATRLFASNLNSRMAARFYTLVLLPRIREDIRTNKRLHFALYQALKKSVYKPSAFYKGIIFPLCLSQTCNLREAVIVGSIIQKVSIPAGHSSVAILKIAEMEYSGTNSYFLKLLLDKKYSLPHRVIDAVVSHFVKFTEEERQLPVIWHQCLLTFVQRYKNSLTEADKGSLKRLMRHQKHYLVTPEVQRELQHSLNRGQKEEDVQQPMMIVTGATTEDVWDLPKVEVEMEE
ncbi:bystin [Selaginella moellendorffii]|nr:bystin [Selaginella moellendorffii]|eukprot:XP_002963678.2 bystin [Selaginella moellendorffii]